eukprot:TRINITY_DN2046_c0_g1_i1.p1 TRINITY_DN2046_c0_g1~~TRINITY_DN2046_c0_g1_i1.p1  ORF type:complete len:279 (+),score=54.49 TRINITY_DN2046_c0_g1_i1:210-1046(+)
MKQFAMDLVKVTKTFSGCYYYSLVQYGEKAHVYLSCGSVEEIIDKLNVASKLGQGEVDPNTGLGRTNTAAALNILTDEVLVAGSQLCQYIKQVVIFITDGCSNEPVDSEEAAHEATVAAALRLHLKFKYPKCFLMPIGVGNSTNLNKDELTVMASKINNKPATILTTNFAGIRKLVTQIEKHLTSMNTKKAEEQPKTTTEKKIYKIGGVKIFSTEKIINTPQGREFLVGKNEGIQVQVNKLEEEEKKMADDYQTHCSEKRKKYRLRGRSSETAKAHRG